MQTDANNNKLQQTLTNINKLKQTLTNFNKLQQTSTNFNKLSTNFNKLQQNILLNLTVMSIYRVHILKSITGSPNRDTIDRGHLYQNDCYDVLSSP